MIQCARPGSGRPFLDVLYERAGQRSTAASVAAFLREWDHLRDELGRPPSIDEYAARWGIARPTAYRIQATFRELFPGETTPDRLLDVLWTGRSDGFAELLGARVVDDPLDEPESRYRGVIREDGERDVAILDAYARSLPLPRIGGTTFGWGYSGLGAATLACSILTHRLRVRPPRELERTFREEVVAAFPPDEPFDLPFDRVDAWLHVHFPESACREWERRVLAERLRRVYAPARGEADNPGLRTFDLAGFGAFSGTAHALLRAAAEAVPPLNAVEWRTLVAALVRIRDRGSALVAVRSPPFPPAGAEEALRRLADRGFLNARCDDRQASDGDRSLRWVLELRDPPSDPVAGIN
jgi:hypothetical protein